MPVFRLRGWKQKPPLGLHRRGSGNRFLFRLPFSGPRRCARYDYAYYFYYAYYRYDTQGDDQRNRRHRRGDEPSGSKQVGRKHGQWTRTKVLRFRLETRPAKKTTLFFTWTKTGKAQPMTRRAVSLPQPTLCLRFRSLHIPANFSS